MINCFICDAKISGNCEKCADVFGAMFAATTAGIANQYMVFRLFKYEQSKLLYAKEYAGCDEIYVELFDTHSGERLFKLSTNKSRFIEIFKKENKHKISTYSLLY